MTFDDWRDDAFLQRRPSVETLAWVAASIGRGSRVVGHRRLTGGVCSAVHRLTVERRGVRTFVVLRQCPAGVGVEAAPARVCRSTRAQSSSSADASRNLQCVSLRIEIGTTSALPEQAE